MLCQSLKKFLLSILRTFGEAKWCHKLVNGKHCLDWYLSKQILSFAYLFTCELLEGDKSPGVARLDFMQFAHEDVHIIYNIPKLAKVEILNSVIIAPDNYQHPTPAWTQTNFIAWAKLKWTSKNITKHLSPTTKSLLV